MRHHTAAAEIYDHWHENSNIVQLRHPMAEFNAREGMDLDRYLEYSNKIGKGSNADGIIRWADILNEVPAIENYASAHHGQRLRLQRFNWPADGDLSTQTVSIVNTPFSVSLDWNQVLYAHYVLAKSINQPMIAFENPGYGGSDSLSIAQRTALWRGEFKPVTDTMSDIIQSMGVKSVNAIGYSMGADLAASFAANANKYHINVERLFVMESPRVVPQSVGKLALNFWRETPNLKFAWTHPADPVLRSIVKLDFGLPKGLTTYGPALYKGGFEQDVCQALETQPDMALIIGASGASKVSPKHATTLLYRRISSSYPQHSSRLIIMPGETHSYGDSVQRYSHLVKMALTDNRS